MKCRTLLMTILIIFECVLMDDFIMLLMVMSITIYKQIEKYKLKLIYIPSVLSENILRKHIQVSCMLYTFSGGYFIYYVRM